MTRSAAFNMLLRVRDELDASRYALSAVMRGWHEHLAAAAVPGGRSLSISDMRRCLENLELTYILRLFATFEAVLRDYWQYGMGRRTEPDLRPLMNSVAGRRVMDAPTLAGAHDIRDFRNTIMHRNLRVLRFDYGQCAKGLGRYLSWLPAEW